MDIMELGAIGELVVAVAQGGCNRGFTSDVDRRLEEQNEADTHGY